MLGNVNLTVYDKDGIERKRLYEPDEFSYDGDKVHWVDCVDASADEIKAVGERFGLHPLVIEDIIDGVQMPKLEDYDEYLFLIIKNIDLSGDEEEPLDLHQVSMILKGNLLLTFREKESYVDREMELKLKSGTVIRRVKADSLMYALCDIIVDHYFTVMEEIDQIIDEVEDKVLDNPEREVLEEIYNLKRVLIYIRRTLWPTRNAVSKLTKMDVFHIDDRTLYYFRDLYDHIIQIIDLTETYREICSGLLDTYLSSIGNKTNEIMKVLTVFSTIFIPLTFIAGVYGMNFKYMPELYWEKAYPAFWVISAVITVIMLIYFKKKDWL